MRLHGDLPVLTRLPVQEISSETSNHYECSCVSERRCFRYRRGVHADKDVMTNSAAAYHPRKIFTRIWSVFGLESTNLALVGCLVFSHLLESFPAWGLYSSDTRVLTITPV